jgi:hypothetical protein
VRLASFFAAGLSEGATSLGADSVYAVSSSAPGASELSGSVGS